MIPKSIGPMESVERASPSFTSLNTVAPPNVGKPRRKLNSAACFGWYRIALAAIVVVGMNYGYFAEDGNNAPSTPEGGEITSSTLEPVTLEIDHCPALPVAIHETPSTITGPTTDCQWPFLIS